MGLGFTYLGASGQRHNFIMVDIDNQSALPMQGGVVVFGYRAPEPIDITQTSSIAGLILNLRNNLKADHPGILIHILVEDDAKRREAIAHDLLEFYGPLKGQVS